MLAVALGLVAIGVLLLFLFPWGGVVIGLVGLAVLVPRLAGRIGHPANRSRV